MPEQYLAVSDDLAEVLEQIDAGTKGDSAKQAAIEKAATEDSRGLVRCQWLGTCYYCFFAGQWWKIACM
jgi:hypothetical protein